MFSISFGALRLDFVASVPAESGKNKSRAGANHILQMPIHGDGVVPGSMPHFSISNFLCFDAKVDIFFPSVGCLENETSRARTLQSLGHLLNSTARALLSYSHLLFDIPNELRVLSNKFPLFPDAHGASSTLLRKAQTFAVPPFRLDSNPSSSIRALMLACRLRPVVAGPRRVLYSNQHSTKT